MDDIGARQPILEGFQLLFGYEPTTTVAQAGQGVGKLESRYGQAWRGAGVGSRNWGAVQASRPPCDPETAFLYTDTHPQPDGSSKPYSICFRKYASEAEGAAGLLRAMYGTSSKPKDNVLKAAERGDLYGVSAALRANGYYEGFGKNQAERIQNHFKALSGCVRAICTARNEPYPTGQQTTVGKLVTLVKKAIPKGINPTLRRGSVGTLVADWQRAIGVVADGHFGPHTEDATKAWQTAKGLVGDGVVGPKTWTALEAEAREAA
jgi:hypothetical protein